jgi:hypothetical protein
MDLDNTTAAEMPRTEGSRCIGLLLSGALARVRRLKRNVRIDLGTGDLIDQHAIRISRAELLKQLAAAGF